MSSPATHPDWCDPQRCRAAEHPTGMHSSRAVVLGPYPPGPVTAEVAALQGPRVDGYPRSGAPFIALTLRNRDAELCFAPLGIELATTLGRVLADLAVEVGG